MNSSNQLSWLIHLRLVNMCWLTHAIFYFDSNRPAWLVVIANSLPIGVIGVWGPVLGVNMDSLDVSQVEKYKQFK